MKLNKKQIGLIAGLACAIVLIVLLLTMCGGNGDHQGVTTEPTQATADTTATEAATEEITEPSEETTEATEETEESTEETTEATTEATTAPTTGNTRPGYIWGLNYEVRCTYCGKTDWEAFNLSGD